MAPASSAEKRAAGFNARRVFDVTRRRSAEHGAERHRAAIGDERTTIPAAVAIF
jgi:hypothetical protein